MRSLVRTVKRKNSGGEEFRSFYRYPAGNAGANKGVLGVVRRDVTPIANTAMTVEQEI